MKRGHFLILILILILTILPFISAEFFSEFFGKITGKATETTNVSVTVSGTNPVVVSVINSTMTGTNVDPTISSNTTIVFFVTVSDSDGKADINSSSVNASFVFYDSGAGQSSRLNSSYGCVYKNDIGNDGRNFSCAIDLTFYDTPGKWNITVYARDLGATTNIANTTQTFQYDTLQSVSISPTSLSFSSVSPGDTNITSNNDPILINNTGNFNFTVIQLNSTNLPGSSVSEEFIPAANFSIGNSTGIGSATDECGGGFNDTILAPQVYKIIDKTLLTRGNYILNDNSTGQEQLFFCIRQIPSSGISSQTYATTATSRWTIELI